MLNERELGEQEPVDEDEHEQQHDFEHELEDAVEQVGDEQHDDVKDELQQPSVERVVSFEVLVKHDYYLVFS